jgi:hypothetical protein
LCLERYVSPTIAAALRNVFGDKKYLAWEARQQKQQRVKAAVAKRIVLDQETSTRAKILVKLLQPIMSVLRLFDRGVPIMSFVYFAMADLRETAKKLVADFKLPEIVQKQVLSIIDDQWQLFSKDMHCAAYLLNPRNHHLAHDLVDDPELKAGLRSVIRKLTATPEESQQHGGSSNRYTSGTWESLTLTHTRQLLEMHPMLLTRCDTSRRALFGSQENFDGCLQAQPCASK